MCLREGAEGRCKVCGATVEDEYIARGRGAEGEGRRLLEAAVAARGAASDEVVARMQEWLRTGAGRILHAWHPVRGEIQDLLSHVLVSHAQGDFRPCVWGGGRGGFACASWFLSLLCVSNHALLSPAAGAQGWGRRALLLSLYYIYIYIYIYIYLSIYLSIYIYIYIYTCPAQKEPKGGGGGRCCARRWT